MDRLALVRQEVDEILRRRESHEYRRAGFVHLYGVSAVCVLLAARRGLDPELSAVAGMLHDIRTYRTGEYDDHARLGAPEAGQILKGLGCFSPEEIAMVVGAIAHHSTKDECHGAFDELLKGADVLQHFLYNPGVADALGRHVEDAPAGMAPYIARWRHTLGELGIAPDATIDG
jgi:uncharacterized protein